ncbi:MAG TPA: glycosyltransferase [Bacteroidota bacterium]|nr:glycosyltransferase [Bacteroidota bacterium]
MNLTDSHNPLVSIIIPVKNGEQTIAACLRAIKRSYYKNYEVIVVDDHSTDATAEIVRQYSVRLLNAENGTGPNFARNLGASQAQGEVLIFIDSDIVVRRETILGIVEDLEDETVDAVVGIYTARHRHETLVSQYKNLWVRYSYIKSPAAIDWLFGAISGIKREAFQNLGGFNSEFQAKYGGEDLELGKRFAEANLHIILDMDIEVEHLKQYTIRSFVANEFRRSMGFAEFAGRLGETGRALKKGFVNVYPAFIASTVYSVLLPLFAAWVWMSGAPAWFLAPAIGFYLILNIRFLNYLEQVRGLFAMMTMIGFLFLDHVVCFAGSVVGLIKGVIK